MPRVFISYARHDLSAIRKPGRTLQIDKPGWRIRYPLEGEARIPADLDKELVQVQLLPVGSKLFWPHDRIEKLISDMKVRTHSLSANPPWFPEESMPWLKASLTRRKDSRSVGLSRVLDTLSTTTTR
jgi:hypothetical protein